jgi:PAS domain S-box-containing protein
MLEALREAEAKYRLISENATDAIYSFDMDRRVVYANPAVAELTGYTFEEMREKGFINWIHPDDQEQMLKIWEELYAGKSYAEVEFRLVAKNGEVKWISGTWGPLYDEAGQQIGVQGRERNVTERKQMESELLEISSGERRRYGHELHDGLGQLLAGVALKTKALEENLAAEGSAQTQKAKALVVLVNDAIRETRYLAQGLDPVHVEANGLIPALEKLAAQSEELFQVECVFTCECERFAVNAQTGVAIYRIAQEAIHNALTHGRARRLELNLALDKSHLRLSIRDNGRGFVPEQTSETGMGLRIMRYRASSVGGRLTIESHPEKGTMVECLVPRQILSEETGKPLKTG